MRMCKKAPSETVSTLIMWEGAFKRGTYYNVCYNSRKINIHVARTPSSAFFATRELARYVSRALGLCKHVRSRSMHMHMHTCTRANRESRRIGARRGPRAVACHERTCRERVSPVPCVTIRDRSTTNQCAIW